MNAKIDEMKRLAEPIANGPYDGCIGDLERELAEKVLILIKAFEKSQEYYAQYRYLVRRYLSDPNGDARIDQQLAKILEGKDDEV